ncbi:MAG: hypothetical protein K6E62_05450 [Lachnospiraceae bacterium]|nr:hypothetical protein [Lachnospiraceae bacterium]
MIKVLKTDLFRLFRTKAFYVFPIFVTVILVLEVMLSGVKISDEPEVYNEDGNVTVSIDINEIPSEDQYEQFGISTLLGVVTDGTLLMFLGIALVIFATNESRNGFVKTAAGCVQDKGYMPLSKIAVSAVIVVIYILEFAVLRFVFTAITAAISGRSLQYVSLPRGDAGKFAGYILLCILVHIAFSAMLMLMHELFRSRAIGIVWIFLESTGLFARLVSAMVMMLQTWFKILPDFNISKYLLMNNISDGYASKAFNPVTVLVMCLVYTGFAGGLAVWMAKYKDVR